MPTILVVDDDQSVLDLLDASLSIEGYDVATALDGPTALTLLHDGLVPDLVVVDWMMPFVEGPELIQIIRRTPEVADVPIIMLTARQGAEHEALAAGADAYFTKPFNPLFLESQIELLLADQASLAPGGRARSR